MNAGNHYLRRKKPQFRKAWQSRINELILPVLLFLSGPSQTLHEGLGADVTLYAYSWFPTQSGRCTQMAISLSAIRESQRMCSGGWRRKTDHREAGRGTS